MKSLIHWYWLKKNFQFCVYGNKNPRLRSLNMYGNYWVSTLVLTLLVSTATTKQSFSTIKIIKTRLRNKNGVWFSLHWSKHFSQNDHNVNRNLFFRLYFQTLFFYKIYFSHIHQPLFNYPKMYNHSEFKNNRLPTPMSSALEILFGRNETYHDLF